MIFEQFYLGCLSHASYLVGDAGEAAVVDPQRDVELYLEAARRHGVAIRHVIETHLHADFVSGHLELAARTGAQVYLGRRAGAAFPHVEVADGDTIRMGGVTLRFLETPGHTPESVSILVFDEARGAAPLKILTGDTLFVGDVGRPDLVTSKGHTSEEMAGMLYDSLQARILPLPDEVEVYPAHGAGSACGRSIGRELSTTLGLQRRVNYALQPMSREQFIQLLTENMPTPPAYFGHDAEANRRGPVPLASLPAPAALDAAAVASLAAGGAVLLDVREGGLFCAGHVPGSVSIGLTGQFASWAGSLLPLDRPIVLIADGPDEVEEARLRLARVGIENVQGFLEGGVYAWDRAGRPLRVLEQVTVRELAEGARGAATVLDVRGPGEFEAGHVPGSINVPLPTLPGRRGEFAGADPLALICQSGFRSTIAASLLAAGHPGPLRNVIGGTGAWQAAGLPIVKG